MFPNQRWAELHFFCDKNLYLETKQLSLLLIKRNNGTYRYIRPEYLNIAEVPETGCSRRGEPQEEQGKEGKSLHNRAAAVANLSEPDEEEIDSQWFIHFLCDCRYL